MSSQPPNKILFIITKSNFGGAQKYVFELAVAAKNNDFTVAVACGGGGELIEKLETANIPVFQVDSFQRDISTLKEIKALLSLRKIINDFRPDIVHLNSSKAGVLGSLAARFCRVPKIIFTSHGWPFLEPRPLPWRVLAWAGSYLTSLLSHYIINVSQFDADHQKMPGIKNKSVVIPIALNTFPLYSRDEARQKLFPKNLTKQHQPLLWLVTIAELNHNKNLSAAIDAVAEFNSTHANKIFYTIIGTGDLLAELQEQVDLKGLNDFVQFLGYVENANFYLPAFDIFLLPSLKEGLPYALLEAGLAGLPSIASAVGGIPEVIKHQETGLLIDPHNHITIVEALETLLNNPNLRFQYSENLKNLIQQKFNFEKMFSQTLKIYQE